VGNNLISRGWLGTCKNMVGVAFGIGVGTEIFGNPVASNARIFFNPDYGEIAVICRIGDNIEFVKRRIRSHLVTKTYSKKG
jgi:hypothetical protein